MIMLSNFQEEYTYIKISASLINESQSNILLLDAYIYEYFVANSAIFLSEHPPFCIGSLALCIHIVAFLLYISFRSPSITSLMHLSTSSLVTKSFSSLRTRTPMRHKLSMYFEMVAWSAQCGIATIGTPLTIASNVEFHPQCVKKQAA
jgi:hypothetical protein